MHVTLLLAQAGTTTTTGKPIGDQLADVCAGERTWSCERVFEWTGSRELAGAAQWIWSVPLRILLILLIAFVVNRVARYIIKRSLNRLLEPPSERTRRAQRAWRRAAPAALLKTSAVNLRMAARVQTLTTVVRSIVSVLIWFVAGFSCLQVVGTDVTALITISSVAGVALGFGAQHMVRDFLAGTFIVIEDQFGVGDTVDLGEGAKGVVEELTLRSTRVRDVHGTVWHVPNGGIERVANKSQEWARAVLDVEIDGGADYGEAAALMERVAETMAGEPQWQADILATPEVWGIESFTETGYEVRLVLQTRPGSQFGIMRELRIRLRRAFDEHGIVLPGAHWALEQALKVEEAAAARPAGATSASASATASADGGMGGDRPAATGGVVGPVKTDVVAEYAAVAKMVDAAKAGDDGAGGDGEKVAADPDPEPPHAVRGDPGEAG
jgi:small-conductance mechanosensitive channel